MIDQPLSVDMREALKGVKAMARVEGAPAVRLEHFLLALIGELYPQTWRRVLAGQERKE